MSRVLYGVAVAIAYAAVLAVFGVTIIEYIAGCGMPEIGGRCVIVGG